MGIRIPKGQNIIVFRPSPIPHYKEVPIPPIFIPLHCILEGLQLVAFQTQLDSPWVHHHHLDGISLEQIPNRHLVKRKISINPVGFQKDPEGIRIQLTGRNHQRLIKVPHQATDGKRQAQTQPQGIHRGPPFYDIVNPFISFRRLDFDIIRDPIPFPNLF